MKKLSLIAGGLFLLFQAGTGWAANVVFTPPTTFTISAQVPQATGVSITVSSVNSTGTAVFTNVTSTTLSFGTLTYNTTNGIFLPNNYFALDFGVTNGAGSPDVTFTYTEGTNPNGTTNGLGYKTVATFAKEVVGTSGTTESYLNDQGPKQRLIDLKGQHVPYTDLNGGFLRVYLGIWTGATTSPADPSNGQPFTTADAPGTYTGSLLITAVVD